MARGDSRRLAEVVAASLDLEGGTRELPRLAYKSRTQFYRIFRALIDETPGEMRRRLLLERAAWRLSRTTASITEIALDADYGSLEAFTRCIPTGVRRLAQHLPPHGRKLLSHSRAEFHSLRRSG